MASDKKEDYSYEPVAGDEEQFVDKATYDAENDQVQVVTSSTMTSASKSGGGGTSSNNNSANVNRKFLYIAACAGNLAAFTCGQAFGWTSPELPKLSSLFDNPLPNPITATESAWIGSLLPLGASIGPFAAGFACDKLGRKKTLLLSVIPFIMAFGMCAFGAHVHWFFIARLFCGLAVGGVFTVLPMYIGEISDNEVRGQLGSFMQLFIVLGLLLSFVVGPFISIKAFNILCLAVPIAFLVIFFLWIPESPYYLVQIDQRDEAEQALMKLRAKGKDGIQKELEEIKSNVDEALANKASFMDIFKSKGLTRALIISVGLVALQQFSGINIVLFFAQTIFTEAGSSLSPEICTIIIGVVQVLASAATPVLVEKRGKRMLLLISAVGMALSQGALAFFFYLKEGGKEVSNLSWLPVASLVFYIITYCLGFGPLPWAVMGELFPGNVKSVASTATAAGCWILGFLITNYFGLVADLIGKSGSFGIFGFCCVLAGLFVFKFVPETSGKSLQEIQDILNGVSKE